MSLSDGLNLLNGIQEQSLTGLSTSTHGETKNVQNKKMNKIKILNSKRISIRSNETSLRKWNDKRNELKNLIKAKIN